MDKHEFAKFVSDKREELDLTLRELADEIGVNWITVWRWERARNCPKDDAMPYWIEKILGVTF